MDFRQAVIAALDRLIESEHVEKCIHKELEKTVASIVHDQLREYSDFGKLLTEKVKKALVLNDDIDLPSYNDAILKIVRHQVEQMTRATIEKQVAENLKDLLTPAPEEITLTALVEQFIEHVRDRQRAGCVCHGEQRISFHVEHSDYGYRHIYFDEEPNKTRRDCAIDLGVSKDGTVYMLRFQNQDVEKRMFAGPFYAFERSLFQMKAARTKVVFDEEPDYITTSYEAAI